MSKKGVFLTADGVKKLEDKLEVLKTDRRQEVAERIKAAISLGDLSENSEYDDAKNEQAFVEGEIMSIENTLRLAQIVESADLVGDTVTVGVAVKVQNMANKEETEYIIVGSDEADPFNRRISNESPVGEALMGRQEGDQVEVNLPNGNRKLKIVSIKSAQG